MSASPYPQNGDGFRSLRAETAARDILRDAEWTAFHSVWYVDAKTGVERELDVAARRSWSRKRDDRRIDLWVVVECKSLGGQNVLFAEQPFDAAESLYHGWLGVDDDMIRARVRKALDETGDGRNLMKRFEKLAHPAGQSAIRTLFPPLPKIRHSASALRTAAREDHDPLFNSWRALLDGVAGAIKEELDDTFTELGIELASRDGNDITPLRSALTSVSMYHPILVVAAPMFFMRSSGELISVDRCRMQHIGISGTRKWFDVVHADALASYVDELTETYTSFFARRRCEPR